MKLSDNKKTFEIVALQQHCTTYEVSAETEEEARKKVAEYQAQNWIVNREVLDFKVIYSTEAPEEEF